MSARRGVTCLIPKKDRDPLIIKNWRPITLLTTDYKILAKLLAIRMKSVRNSIIDNCQSGYMEGRFIGTNLRKLIDIIETLKSEKQNTLYISIDFEKCFDTVEITSLLSTLDFFNFGPYIKKLVITLYTDFETCVSNEWYISD